MGKPSIRVTYLEEPEQKAVFEATLHFGNAFEKPDVYVEIRDEGQLRNIFLTRDQAADLTKHLLQWLVDTEE